MKNFRRFKLFIGSFLLLTVAAITHSCRPTMVTCYKTSPPDEQDTAVHKNINQSCYNQVMEPKDSTNTGKNQ